MQTIGQDLRYAIRMLLRTPGFTIVAILTLAFGIGANTAVFSLVNAALFRRVDAADPGRLVWVTGTRDRGRPYRNISYPEYAEHRAQDSTQLDIMMYQDVSLALGSGGEPARITGLLVSGNYFRVLGTTFQLGRGFSDTEDRMGDPRPVVVLGDQLWRHRFGADSAIVGRPIVLNGHEFTVIGVAPRGFNGLDLGQPGEAWVPFSTIDWVMPSHPPLEERFGQWLRAVGRLRPAATLAGARARVQTTGRRLMQDWGEDMAGNGATVEPLAGGLDPNNRAEGIPIFALLMAVPAMVLLIACANAANLLLARAAARRREIGVRLALGASRWRIVRMLTAESLLLSTVASVVALLCALWLTDLIGSLGAVPASITDAVAPDGRVLAFTLALGLVTGLLFGLVPALGATRASVVPALKDDGIAGTRLSKRRLVRTLVIGQVAVSLVLLVLAGLFLRTLAKATRVETGFETDHGLALQFDLSLQGYDVPREMRFYEDLLARTRTLPGITSASLAGDLPLSNRGVFSQVLREDEAANVTAGSRDEGTAAHEVSFTTAWPDLFRTLGTPLVAGRDFTPRDDASAPMVAIVNETLARQLWPGQSAIGKRLRLIGRGEQLMEVIGIARDAKYHELTEGPTAFIYMPNLQRPDYVVQGMSLVARTTGDPTATLGTLRSVLREMDRNLPVYGLVTLSEHVRQRLDKERGASALLGSFGALALLLATLGLYGVMAYAVTQRTKEIGIRMALGAARREVLRLVVGEGVRLAGTGILIGLVLAAGLTQVIRRFLYGVTPTDAATFIGVAVLMSAVAAAASLVPARRAATVDPVVSLRND